jgi:hypothetical protein
VKEEKQNTYAQKKKYIAKKLTANTSVPLEANNAAFC